MTLLIIIILMLGIIYLNMFVRMLFGLEDNVVYDRSNGHIQINLKNFSLNKFLNISGIPENNIFYYIRSNINFTLKFDKDLNLVLHNDPCGIDLDIICSKIPANSEITVKNTWYDYNHIIYKKFKYAILTVEYKRKITDNNNNVFSEEEPIIKHYIMAGIKYKELHFLTR